MKLIHLATIAALSLATAPLHAAPKGDRAKPEPKKTEGVRSDSASPAGGGESPAGGKTGDAGGEDHGKKIFGIVDSEALKVDLRAIDAAKGNFGIDYKLDLRQSLNKGETEDNPSFVRRSVSLKSTGFLVTEPSKNRHDSIITEAAFNFDPLYPKNPILTSDADNRDLLKQFMSGKITEEELRKAQDRINKQKEPPLWIYAKGSAKWETTQTGKDQDLAIGAALVFATNLLHPILDAPFKLVHAKDNSPRFLDVSIGYDYVTARKVSSRAESDADKNRLSLYAEWETGIFKSDRLVFAYTGNYDLDGTKQGFHSFAEITYKHYLFNKDAKAGTDGKSAKKPDGGGNKSAKSPLAFSIKYTAGQLAPTYKQGNVIGAGFSIDF